jgi:hypothetical protein
MAASILGNKKPAPGDPKRVFQTFLLSPRYVKQLSHFNT